MSVAGAAGARQLIPWQDILVHALVAEVVIAFLHASPEHLVGAEVLHFAGVAEDEAEVELPTCFLSVWV